MKKSNLLRARISFLELDSFVRKVLEAGEAAEWVKAQTRNRLRHQSRECLSCDHPFY